MEGDTKKNQGLNTNIPPSAPNTPSTSATNSVNFSSNDIGRTTVAHKEHKYFTNVKKERKSLKQIFSQPPKQFFTKKRIIIIAIVVLLLIATLVTLIFFLTHNDLPQPSDNIKQSDASIYSDEEYENKKSETADMADKNFETSGTSELISVYDSLLQDEKMSKIQKADLYLSRIYKLYEIKGLYGDSVEEQIRNDAYSAEELNPSFESAQAIYEIEKLLSNTETAEKYHQIMKERNPDYSEGQYEIID